MMNKESKYPVRDKENTAILKIIQHAVNADRLVFEVIKNKLPEIFHKLKRKV